LAEKHSSKGERFLQHLEPLQGALEAYCRRSLRDGSEVADTLQGAVANAFRDFRLYAEGTNFRAWMFRYVSLEVLNRNRAWTRRRASGLPDELPAAPEGFVLPKERELMAWLLEEPESVLDHCEQPLSQAIRRLNDSERSVLLLRSIGEFKYREIAEILEVPVGTVMGWLFRARQRLRNELADFARTRGLWRRGEAADSGGDNSGQSEITS
jgi:RNA polymerase sigma-70 factor (ECF subfamily)